MHKIYENDDLMMYFKKRYCYYCGEVLKTHKTERIIKNLLLNIEHIVELDMYIIIMETS